MHIHDDLNNRRIRQLIEQFNVEEAHEEKLRIALEQLREVIATAQNLADLGSALRKLRWKLPTPPPVNAVGFWMETASSFHP
jgi:hypothetical protein